jgi:hypothetical protein
VSEPLAGWNRLTAGDCAPPTGVASLLSTSRGLEFGEIGVHFAVAFELNYLVTWNCKHIANGQVIRRLGKINQDRGRPTPVIVTPEELLPREQGESS